MDRVNEWKVVTSGRDRGLGEGFRFGIGSERDGMLQRWLRRDFTSSVDCHVVIREIPESVESVETGL